MSGIVTAFAGAGFVKSLVTSISSQNPRKMIWPIPAQSGPRQPFNAIQTGMLSHYTAILEEHRHEVDITEHPVEQGADITDHAYVKAREVTIQIGFTPSSTASSGLPNLLGILPVPSLAGFTGAGNNNIVKSIFAELVAIKAQRLLLTVYTGKTIYKNMLIRSLTERTTVETENALIITLGLKEILIANVTALQVPTNPTAQTAPQDTTPSVPQGAQTLQPAPAFNSPTVST